jgi:hypothetical protein
MIHLGTADILIGELAQTFHRFVYRGRAVSYGIQQFN